MNRFKDYRLLVLLVLLLGSCTEYDGTIRKKIVTGDFILRTQADVHAFAAEFEDIPNLGIEGSLTIGHTSPSEQSSDIISLEPLSKLSRISKNLTISMNQQLASLKGLENLKKVDGNLRIQFNGLEEGLMLNSLRHTDSLLILQNTKLPNMAGLSSLRQAGTVKISQNPQLQDLRGLDSLINLKSLYLENNSNLVHLLGLERLKEVGTMLLIRENSRLRSLQGLGRLEKVGLEMNISLNPELQALSGLSVLKQAGTIKINQNLSLSNLCALKQAVEAIISVGSQNPAEQINLNGNAKASYTYEQLLEECKN